MWFRIKLAMLAAVIVGAAGCDTSVPMPVSKFQLARSVCGLSPQGFDNVVNLFRLDRTMGVSQASAVESVLAVCTPTPTGWQSSGACELCGKLIIEAVWSE